VYSCKTMQDISDNLLEISQPSHNNTSAEKIYAEQRGFFIDIYQKLLPLIIEQHELLFVEEKIQLFNENNNAHFNTLNSLLYQQISNENEISDGYLFSTLLNVNREIHHSIKNMMSSIIIWQQLQSNLQKVIPNE